MADAVTYNPEVVLKLLYVMFVCSEPLWSFLYTKDFNSVIKLHLSSITSFIENPVELFHLNEAFKKKSVHYKSLLGKDYENI